MRQYTAKSGARHVDIYFLRLLYFCDIATGDGEKFKPQLEKTEGEIVLVRFRTLPVEISGERPQKLEAESGRLGDIRVRSIALSLATVCATMRSCSISFLNYGQ